MITLAKPMFGIEEKTLAIKVLSSGKLAQDEILVLFKNAPLAAERIVSIPIHPGLTRQEVDYNVSSLQKYA